MPHTRDPDWCDLMATVALLERSARQGPADPGIADPWRETALRYARVAALLRRQAALLEPPRGRAMRLVEAS